MTTAEVSTMLLKVGIPTAYYQFQEDTGQQPPFICFYYPESDDVYADNINYQSISRLTVELYTEDKDFALESTLEGVLTEAGLAWDKTETYIGSERMYEIIYTMEVLINA